MFLAYNFLYCDIYFDCFGFHYFSPTTLDQGNKKNLHTITKQYDFEESQIFPPHYELFYSFYLLIIQSNENNSSENCKFILFNLITKKF